MGISKIFPRARRGGNYIIIHTFTSTEAVTFSALLKIVKSFIESRQNRSKSATNYILTEQLNEEETARENVDN